MSASGEESFNQKSPVYSKAFLVEDRELWFPPQVLACVSEVFKNMFYGEYAETEKEIVPLPGKKYEEVLEFLRCLVANPLAKEISDENLEWTLKLADEYHVQDLTCRCDEYMREKIKEGAGTHTILSMLELASLYHLDNLLEVLIPRVAEMSLSVIRSGYKRQIRSNIFMAILDLKVERKEEQPQEVYGVFNPGSLCGCGRGRARQVAITAPSAVSENNLNEPEPEEKPKDILKWKI